MTNKMLILVALLAAVMCTGSVVADVVVFQDNFENVAGVTWPDFSNDADPVAQIGQYIEVQEQRTGLPDSIVDVQVCTNAGPGSPDGSSNYLVLDRVLYAGVRAKFSQRVTEKTTIEFDYYVTADASHTYGMGVNLLDNPNVSWANIVVNDYFKTNGWYVSYPNMAGNAFLVGLDLNAWNHVKYVIDFDTQTFDITVDDQTFTGLDFYAPATGLEQIFIGGEYYTSTSYIDNLIVTTVPEPATLLILTAGSVLGIRKRR